MAYALPLLCILVLGSTRLYEAFHGDQALFVVGAQALDDGAVLYRDFWDLKQPGIYAFYLAGGRLFGFTEAGIHLFELLYHLCFAAFLIYVLRRELSHPWLASVAALTTVGAYYVFVDHWHLTQIEALVGAPLFLSLWLAYRAHPLAAGIAGGVALLFKVALAPILLIGWLIGARARRDAGPLLLGLVLVFASAALWFWWRGALAEAAWTTFVYPFAALREFHGAPLGRVLGAVIHYGRMHAVLILLAFFAPRDRLTLQLAGWVFAALPMFFIQRYVWWPFHLLVLGVPLGVLAVRGLDTRRPALAGVLAAAAVLRWPGAGDDRAEYRELERSTSFLSAPEAAAGPIFVLGNPLNLYLSGRKPAVPMHGWCWEVMLEEQWQRLREDLTVARPVYLYLDDRSGAALRTWVEAEYAAVSFDATGTWYSIRAAETGAAP